jgi:hypothetical protein
MTITLKKQANTHKETKNADILQQRAQKRSLGSGELRKHIPKRYPNQVQILIVQEKTKKNLLALLSLIHYTPMSSHSMDVFPAYLPKDKADHSDRDAPMTHLLTTYWLVAVNYVDNRAWVCAT